MCVCMCILLTCNLAFIVFSWILHAVVGVYWHRKLVNTQFILTLYESYQMSYPLQIENQTCEVELGDDVI